MTEALGSKITSRLDSICDSSLHCELSKLESLCEEVLEDQEDFISKDDLNGNQTRLRTKRNISPQLIETTTTTTNGQTYSQSRNFKNENITSVLPIRPDHTTRISKPPKRKGRWFARRRRRSRIKLLFKMLGKDATVSYTYDVKFNYLLFRGK